MLTVFEIAEAGVMLHDYSHCGNPANDCQFRFTYYPDLVKSIINYIEFIGFIEFIALGCI